MIILILLYLAVAAILGVSYLYFLLTETHDVLNNKGDK